MSEEYKVVSRWVFDPKNALFKQPANAKAECETIWCKLDNCPLREKGQCTFSPVLGWDKCPYGRVDHETGPTKRANSFRSWIQERKDQYPDVSRLSSPTQKIAFIGEYVYLPYSHMSMNENVSFLAKSHAFSNGCAFLPIEDWTLVAVLSIIDFRPQALLGGEIKAYQKEQVPKFLEHLREEDPEMWQKVIAERPELDKEPNYVGRKALLRTLHAPIVWKTKHDKYNVMWKWDGKRVYTSSYDTYNSTWGEIKLASVALEGIPEEDAEIVVQDNSWVNKDTEFVD